jgi:hypothetical protein
VYSQGKTLPGKRLPPLAVLLLVLVLVLVLLVLVLVLLLLVRPMAVQRKTLPPLAVAHRSRSAVGPSSSAPAPSSLATSCKNSLHNGMPCCALPQALMTTGCVTGHCMTVSVAVLLRYKNKQRLCFQHRTTHCYFSSPAPAAAT